jgi:hypothetical protein
MRTASRISTATSGSWSRWIRTRSRRTDRDVAQRQPIGRSRRSGGSSRPR